MFKLTPIDIYGREREGVSVFTPLGVREEALEFLRNGMAEVRVRTDRALMRYHLAISSNGQKYMDSEVIEYV